MAETVVLDANVAAMWILTDEPYANVADNILVAIIAGDIEAHAPRIFTYEVSGTLTKACAGKRLTPATAIQFLEKLFGLPIIISPASKEEAQEALQMATQFSKTHADMTYLRLAEMLDVNFCTADEKLLIGGTPPGFPTHRIVLLASLAA